MPVSSLSASVPAGSADLSATANGQGGGGDFLALLAISGGGSQEGGRESFAGGAALRAPASVQDKPRQDSAPDAGKDVVDAPEIVRQKPPVKTNAEQRDDAPPRKDRADSAAGESMRQEARAAVKESGGKTAPAQTAQDTDGAEKEHADKPWEQALEELLARFAQIVTAALQALPAEKTTTPGSDQGATAEIAPVAELSGQMAQGLPVAPLLETGVPALPGAAAAERALLEEIQALTAQLQQYLAADDATGQGHAALAPQADMDVAASEDTPLAMEIPSPADDIPDETLQAMLARLAQLTLRLGEGMKTPPAPGLQLAVPSQGGDAAGALKTKLTQSGDALQALAESYPNIAAKLRGGQAPQTVLPEKTAVTALAEAGVAVKDGSADQEAQKPRQPIAADFTTVSATASSTGVAAPAAHTPEAAQGQAMPAVAAMPAGAGDQGANSGGSHQEQAAAQPAPVAAQASTAAMAGTNGTHFSRLLGAASADQMLPQVTFQVKTALQNGGSRITIQLHPADLGRLDIRLEVDAHGKTGVVITADNAQTLDLLQRDAHGLTKALADAGLKADSGSLSFNLSGGQQQEARQDNAAPLAMQYQKMQPAEEQELDLHALTRSYVAQLAEGVDITI